MDVGAIEGWHLPQVVARVVATSNPPPLGQTYDDAERKERTQAYVYDACRYHLGVLYLYGSGVEQDIVRGYLLIASAAQIGDKASIDYLQEMESRMRPEELEQGRRRLAAGDDGLEEPPR